MNRKPRLYVDANLKITKSLHNRKAVVNIVNGCFEITFLNPIAYAKDLSDAWRAKGDWHRRYYTSYPASLPRAESCLFANEAQKEPFFKSCHTSSSSSDYHGRCDFWYMIDDDGQKVRDAGDVLENVYVSILLTHDEFFRINPWADISPYGLSRCA